MREEKQYKVTLIDGTEFIIEAPGKTSAMIRALGKALEQGKKDIVLSGKGYCGSGIKSCKVW